MSSVSKSSQISTTRFTGHFGDGQDANMGKNLPPGFAKRTLMTKPADAASFTHVVNEDGAKVVIRLFAMASIPIRRRVKVKNAANPYDPTWEVYFEQRQYNRVLADREDRPRLRHQCRLQRGICPVCGERITKENGWHNHHIHWRVYGGSDDLENRVLLHPNCHRQVHNPDYEGPPLRPSVGVRDA